MNAFKIDDIPETSLSFSDTMNTFIAGNLSGQYFTRNNTFDISINVFDNGSGLSNLTVTDISNSLDLSGCDFEKKKTTAERVYTTSWSTSTH